ncbi:trypsin-like serine peptidase [Streptomyces sp. 4N509B]|uniref:trypsin-like serine peptidase n=1 Tax=Streptomyces sp. 4N509B TaxID=3457413 RepID=UPI003FD22D6F
MSSIRRRPGRRRAAMAATALAACLALTATACSGDDEPGGGGDVTDPSDDAAADDRVQDILDNLPFEVDLDAWTEGEWRNWDEDRWLSELGDFINPIIEDLWNPDRFGEAEDPDQDIDDEQIEEDPSPPESDDPDDDRGITDPQPEYVEAAAVPAPYQDLGVPAGRVFFDTPEGPMVCSGTVVSDPANPGQSNLVATAGHCVHAGTGGGWYRNVIFVPYYNPGALSAEELAQAPFEEVAPHGIWWADYVSTTQYWVDNGAAVGGGGAHGDFAVMSVQPEEGGNQSLEELVGGSVPVNFDAPAVSGLGDVTLYGYPAAAPYDGELMYSCAGTPARLSLDATMPVMYWAGCSMTGGSSGGPWLRTGDGGGLELISVNSIGDMESTYLAGPRLEDEARGVFDDVSSQ